MAIDVNQDEFQDKVVARSHDVPVVVDFWAPWCAPCRTLGPIIEKVVAEAGGAVELAKVNVDENQQLAAAFGVQGIPAVVAIQDGEVAGQFTGAQPEAEVRRFVESLRPSEADLLAAQGTEESLRAALDLQPDHLAAVTGLAALLVERGDLEEAGELLRRVPSTAEVERLRAEIELGRMGADAEGDEGAALVAAGDHEGALAHYLARVKTDRDDVAREAMVSIFTVLGDDHPLTRKYRPLLAGALF